MRMKKLKNFVKGICLFALLMVLPAIVNASTLVKSVVFDGIGELNTSKNTWNLNLTTTLDYVDIDVVPISDSVKITGAGKVNVEEGDNTIEFTATDGTTEEKFTVNVKISRPSENNSGNPETGSFLPIGMVALGLGIILIIYNYSKAKIVKI